MYIALLGRQPALSMAELEALLGASKIKRLSEELCLLDIDKIEFNPDHFGGTIKIMEVIREPQDISPQTIMRDIEKNITSLFDVEPPTKLTIGLSVFNISLSNKQLTGYALALKKILKQKGFGVRVVPNKDFQLSTPQILHNKLTADAGLELNLIQHNKQIYVARTVWVQDIEAYTARDQARPMRDARVGMLPPKLAQIMINVARRDHSPVTNTSARLLDPFCGTGVVLQEAALMGYAIYGSDLSEKMVRYSRDNINWLEEKEAMSIDWYVHEGDAAQAIWQAPIDIVVCEMYLGAPFASLPPRQRIEQERHDCNKLLKAFLENIGKQVKPGTKMCIAVPAWRTGLLTQHLPLLDDISSLGYTRASFEHANKKDLLYFREDQVVARELLVITKN